MATVLVIDDEEMIRSLAERILQRESHKVYTAENGIQALSLFEEHNNSIDIVIIDMILDDMNGFDILVKIRKLNPDIPGIISSGNIYNIDDIPENVRKNVHFLQKPYRAAVLTELVNSLVVTS